MLLGGKLKNEQRLTNYSVFNYENYIFNTIGHDHTMGGEWSKICKKRF